MNDRIKVAFEQVQAEDKLKDKTKEFILQKTNGYKRANFGNYKYLAVAFACIALLFVGVHWLFFTPTVEISIDINPSVELGVNRFNCVISFKSYNDDGQELVNSLDVKFMNYTDAVKQIMESEDIVSLLSDDEVMTIAVTGSDSTQSEEVLANIQSCTAEKSNTYCYYAHSEEVEQAHEVGLSYGKYKAFLELQELDPNITADEIKNLTMREIKDMISNLSDDGKEETKPSESCGNGNQNNHNGQGKKNRKGNKSDE